MSAAVAVRTSGAWAAGLDRWHDERRIVHFIRDVGPVVAACGFAPYSFGGTRRETYVPANACRRCAKIAAKVTP